MASFHDRVSTLPRLGVGVSCEFDAGQRGPGVDAVSFRRDHPELVHFLEIGADVRRGLDDAMRRWAATGAPTTYHFLDVNLAETQDVDDPWIQATEAQADQVGAAWLCGDAGYWHFGPRERGHDVLLPPILSADAAREMAEAIALLQARCSYVVLPENPPATAYVGPLHLLDFYARVVDAADCGMLLDAAHLAIFQRMRGCSPTDGFDDFPLDRIVEVHVAGGTTRDTAGFTWIDDTHTPEPLPETWAIFEALLARAPNLRAVVYECEHNAPNEVIPNFQRLNAMFPKEAR
ncbi:MAG: DUF692 family protein [Alphaproteobacteria bacterium]|nr:DUF692 family protein [Alphaproteobacteria bacterium]